MLTEQQKIGLIVVVAVVAVLSMAALCKKKKGGNPTGAIRRMQAQRQMPMQMAPAMQNPNLLNIAPAGSQPVVGVETELHGENPSLPLSEGRILMDGEMGNNVTYANLPMVGNPDKWYYNTRPTNINFM